MFAVLERDGLKQAVHSQRDYDYLTRRGFKPVKVAAILKSAAQVAQEPDVQPVQPVQRVKRKYTRKQQ